jgi:GT2 family glycosyltransferase
MSPSLLQRLNRSEITTHPRVLVGIVTHNRAGILPKAIQSALSQSYPNVEVAVLDDGSQDETSALPSGFPAVRWHRWESPHGLMEARNHLMRIATADYYISLDDDAWFLNDNEIVTAIDHMESNPRVAAVAFDILTPDRACPAPRFKPRPTSMFIGCGHVIRITALRECGFYVPSPGLYGSEEKDLCLRLLDHAWDIHLLPGVHVWHDRTMITRDHAAQHLSSVCNDLAFALRRCPLPLAIIVLPTKLLSHLRFSLRRRLMRPFFAGLGMFFRNARAVWQSRNSVRTRTFTEFLRRSREGS